MLVAMPRAGTTRPKPASRKRASGGPILAQLLRGLKPALMPRDPPLMLCSLVDAPFDGREWIFEPKLDGLRVVCRIDGKGGVDLVSRNDKPQAGMFPDIVDALRRATTRPVMLDGEIVALDDRGRSSFRLLQQRFHVTNPSRLRERTERFPAHLYVFDLLYLDRYDLRDLPLEQRKQLLHSAVRWNERIHEIDVIRGKGTPFFRRTCDEGGEGIVAKRLDSQYTGERGEAWLKIKCSGRQEFVIGGFTDPQRSRVGLGALLVGYYDNDGETFRYAGKVGTGFNREMLLDLRSRLDKLRADDSPFAGNVAPAGENVHYVKPKLVGEFAYAEWTQNDLLRQPRFEGLREDKRATSVRRERAKHADAR
jgi:bifunctional non-homologous end joining protein LigD